MPVRTIYRRHSEATITRQPLSDIGVLTISRLRTQARRYKLATARAGAMGIGGSLPGSRACAVSPLYNKHCCCHMICCTGNAWLAFRYHTKRADQAHSKTPRKLIRNAALMLTATAMMTKGFGHTNEHIIHSMRTERPSAPRLSGIPET